MSALAAVFRLLYSSEAGFDSKLEAAEQLVDALLGSAGAAPTAAAQGLPPLVCGHYLRSLVEWSCGALTKGSGPEGGKKKKKEQQQQQQQGEHDGQPARLQPRCWAVLAAVLGSSSTPASQPLPAALLPAVTATLQLAARGQLEGGPEQGQLLAQVAALLRLLAGKFGGSYRPGIEHAVAAAEAALAGHAAAASSGHQAEWEPVAAAAAQLLLGVASGHPNQRKVWDAAVPRLLPLLAQAAFPAGESTASDSQLASCCRQLLDTIVFHQQHVLALAAAAAAEMAAAVAEAGGGAAAPAAAEAAMDVDGAAEKQEEEAVAAAGGGASKTQHSGGGYAKQLFAVLRQQAAGGTLPLDLLPWMAGQFCAALKQHRRAAETEAELISQAGRRSQRKQEGEEGDDAGGAPAAASGHKGGSGSGLSVSADFHFWLALLRTLAPRMQQPLGQPEGTVRGVALLAGALRQHHLYRPTQDPTGQQRQLLQQLADAALALAQAGDAAAAAAAALGVLRGILAVEHRVIQQQLPLLWPLLLHSPAAAGSGADGGVAAAVACSLVGTFGELRQLETLLQSLIDALLVPASGEAPAPADAAAAVLGSGQFRAALAAAVGQVPSGQVPVVLRLVAAALPRLSQGSGGSQLLAADLCYHCLASLQVDLVTAAAAATAAAALVAALAPQLLPLLGAAASSSSKAKKQKAAQQQDQALLPALLRLYRQALLLHARCAALHPEVAPLPGQHTQPVPGSSSRGYFAPLLDGSNSSAEPAVPALLQAAAAAGRGDAQLALMQAAEQRLRVLHQQQRHLTRTCPVTLLPGPGQSAQQQGGQQDQQELLQQVEGELQQLATALVAAAAGAADASSAALQLVVEALQLLQEWAAAPELQQLLQSCLREATAAPAGPAQLLCCRLLLDSELVEQRQLAALLPAVAAAELGSTLRSAFGGAAPDAEGGSAQKKSKKGSKGGAAAAAAGSAAGGELLQQLERLSCGKAVKSSSWAAAVEASATGIASLAADAGSSSACSSGKKRKQQDGDAAGGGAAAAASLQRLRRQVQLLGELPLQHLQPDAAAGMAAVVMASLLCGWEGSLSLLQAAGSSQRQELVTSTLQAAAGCLQLLASLARGSSHLGSEQQLLPGVLQAVLAATASAAAPEDAGYVAAAAAHSSSVMQSLCAASLASLDGTGTAQTGQRLGQQLQQPGPMQWAAAVLAQGCLAACTSAVQPSGSSAAPDIVCGASGSGQQPDGAAATMASVAAPLDAAVSTALPAAAAAAESGGWRSELLAGSLYGCAASLLRLRCCDHPAAEALEQQAGGGGCTATMAAGLQAAAALLEQLAASQETGPVLLRQPLLDYLAACCCVTGRMRPAASSSHYSSLLALLLRQLALQPPAGAAVVPPSRSTIPFTAAFPAATAVALQQNPGGGSAARPLLLEALQELAAGSSSQQLVVPLRFLEAALPAPGAAMALPLCELLLVLLEAAGGRQQQRLLGQHSVRLAALLTGFLDSAAYSTAQRQQQPPSLVQLAADIAAAGEGGACTAAAPEPPAAAAPAAGAPAAAELAALCTALRALESLAARPRLFPLLPASVTSMLASLADVWTAYAEQPSPAGAALPGFRFRLGLLEGAGLFAGSCHLLLALLRHRQQELRRCLPLVLRALRGLLHFLVATELSARLQQAGAAAAAGPGAQLAAAEERQWRVKCAELLASVLAELSGLKEGGIGRYCPQLLADYLLLAAAPPSAKSRALLHYSSPAAHGAAGDGSSVAAAAAAAAAAEEDVLAGEPLSPEVAAALRRGAYALYGACSPAEVQFLYASLGGAGGPRGGSGAVASWRSALAALKADFEKHHKYMGKV